MSFIDNESAESVPNATILDSISPSTIKHYPLIYYFVPFYALLFLIGTFGNGLVIITILRSTRLRTVTNTYLLNIAVADFLLLLSIPFLIVTILANGWIFGNILCKMYYNFIHINQYISSLLLAALSFDRYLAVCHPIRAIEFRTRTKCVLIIGGCWLISVLFLCPTWVFATVTSEHDIFWHGYRVQRCVIDFPAIIFTIPPEIVFTYYGFFLGFLIPASMITTFYILVLIRLHKIRRKHQSEMKQRSHRKVTRVVLAVITAYFICWVPYWFLQIFITIDPLIHSLRLNFSILPVNSHMRFLKELTHLTTMLGYANNCLNPALYVFFSESFREEYILILKGFHPNRIFQRDDLHYANAEQRPIKPKQVLRRSVKQRKRRDQVLKKVKHSVAVDELPLDSRSCSLTTNGKSSTQRRSSPPTGLIQQIAEYQTIEMRLFSSKNTTPTIRASTVTTASRLSQNKSTMMRTQSSTTILDDGGVYCGD